MHPMLNIAVRAAREAGNIIARSFPHVDSLAVDTKASNDFVSDVDRMAEQAIIQLIRKHYPDHAILAEESGQLKGNEEYLWIIDPLDGTTNFLHGFPQFAVSIALQFRGKLDQAVVYDPISQDLYTASRGSGAQLNGRRIRVTNRKGLDGALLGTGFPFKSQHLMDTYLCTFKALSANTAGIRRPGSAALDLAYVAAGRMDGFWEFDLQPWDMAAGALLVMEASGKVGDFAAGEAYLQSGNVIAGNLNLFDAMHRAIKPCLPAEITH
ncbi:MAG: inositol monophosphatase [Gammaproteobacteria bacterium]|nr:inositol monophosphatase [Gammaproteobacteria bacterium]